MARLTQVLFTVPRCIVTEKLMADLWAAIVQSFQKMATNRTGTVFAIIGDLDWFYSEFGFPRHNQANPCPWCYANQMLCVQYACFVMLFPMYICICI